jgi:hypothetical protein
VGLLGRLFDDHAFALLRDLLVAHGGEGIWRDLDAERLAQLAPWAAVAPTLMWIPRHLREHRNVLIGMALIALTGAFAFLMSTVLPENWMRYVAFVLGTPCISLMFPCFWYLPSQIFNGAHAAAAMAAITTLGSLGGFLSQNLMPWVAHWSGSALAAMIVPAMSLALLSLSAIIMLAAWRSPPNAGFDFAASPSADSKHPQSAS